MRAVIAWFKLDQLEVRLIDKVLGIFDSVIRKLRPEYYFPGMAYCDKPGRAFLSFYW
jgi:hypothetical protein